MRAWLPVLVLVMSVALGACGGGGGGKEDVAADADASTPQPDADAAGDLDSLEPDLGPDVIPDTKPQDTKDSKDTESDSDSDSPDVPLCPADCDDNDDCTIDQCVDGTGCVHNQVPDCCQGQNPFSQDFEAANPLDGWTVKTLVPPYSDKPELQSYTWNLVTTRSHSPGHSLYFGNPDAQNYDNGHRVAASATSPEISLAPDAALDLSFWVFLGVEEGKYSDFFSLNVIVDGETIRVYTKTDLEVTGKWINVAVSLDAFSGNTIQLQFVFDSKDEHENSLEGIYIDDIQIVKSCEPPPACTATSCNDNIPCTKDECIGGKCKYTLDAKCCLAPTDCEDWDGCTIEKCSDNVCSALPDPDPACCNTNDVCHDEDDVCTIDVCKNNQCEFLPSGEPGCCVEDVDCNDQDSCTADKCIDNTCYYTNVCCSQAEECDDGDDVCTNDVCQNGKCVFLPTGAEGCCAPQVVLEDFEDGQAQGFIFEAANESQMKWVVGEADAYQGNWSMGITATGVSSSLSAEAILPVAAMPVVGGKLSFYLKQTVEDSGDCDTNRLVVKFNDAVLRTECNTIADWYKVEVLLSDHAGEQGELSIAFYASPWSSSSYTVMIDKVSVVQQCCSANADCNDENPCTTDTCPGVSSICNFEPIEGCCLGDSQCNDNDACTFDKCTNNWCEHINECCANDSECNDNDDVCTSDKCIGQHCYFEPTGVAGCCKPERFNEPFEGSLGLWTITNPTGGTYGWWLSDNQAVSGTTSLYFGNEAGTQYGSNLDGSVVSSLIDLPGAPEATLSFQTYYSTEASYDELRVYIVTPDNVDHLLEEISGSVTVFVEKTYDISPYVGQKIRVKFAFHSDGSGTGIGAYVDDVKVTIGCCDTNTQCEDNNPCTTDSCPGTQSMCANVPVPGCCLDNDGCDDNDVCTVDVCDASNECSHTNICCGSDTDCDDGDDICTEDICLGGFCFFQPTATPGCCEPTVAGFDFEDGNLATSWVIQNSGTSDNWKIGTTKAYAGTKSLYFGNSSENSYSNYVDSTITTKNWIELPNAPGLTLSFRAWPSTESCCDELAAKIVTLDDTEILLGEVAGQASTWELKNYPLAAYAGQKVKIMFTFHSDSSSTYQGVWVDDIRIEKLCCNSNADCDDGSVCTVDSCPGPVSNCVFAPVLNCCEAKEDCNDLNNCTLDICDGNQCSHIDICCSQDSDCDDGDPVCTNDVCVSGICDFVPSGASGCCEPSLYVDDFESGSLSSYTIVNDVDSEATWHISTTGAQAGSKSLVFSNQGETNYGNYVDAYIMTPEIYIAGQALDPYLGFGLRFATESCCDRLSIYVVKSGTDTLIGEYKGTQENWANVAIPLGNFKGESIKLKFLFHSDSSSTYWGAKIDNLGVFQDCCNESSECDDGNVCTTDVCPGPESVCINQAVAGCCLNNDGCNDNQACTSDICQANHTCKHVNICCLGDGECDDGDNSCTNDACVNGFCEFAPTGAPGCCTPAVFRDDFSTDKGWTFTGEWGRGIAAASTCAWTDYDQDPSEDHSDTGDNYLIGVNIGGCVTENPLETWFYATSPVIDISGAGAVYVSYWRYLNSDSPIWVDHIVEVWNGSAWVSLWAQEEETIDFSWSYWQFDVAPYKSSTFQVRFGVNVYDTLAWASPSWSIDDFAVVKAEAGSCCVYDSECEGFDAVCLDGECVDSCMASCAGKECGPNACGGSCGTCAQGDTCLSTGQCCTPDCSGAECGSNGCGGTCGSCGTNEVCSGKVCACAATSVACGAVCCNTGEVCDSGTCCLPDCGGKECGSGGCGVSCGSCSDLEMCDTGMCRCDWLKADLAGQFQRISYAEFGDSGMAGGGLDIDEDPATCAPAGSCEAGIDNSFADFMVKAGAFVNADLALQTLIGDGTISALFEFVNATTDGAAFTMRFYNSKPDVPSSECDYLSQTCDHTILEESFSSDTCLALNEFDDAIIEPSPTVLVFGSIDYAVYFPIRFSNGSHFMLPIYMTHITADMDVSGNDISAQMGILGGAIRKADLVAMINVMPAVAGLPGKTLLLALVDEYLTLDVDTDGDGTNDAASFAWLFETIAAGVSGI